MKFTHKWARGIFILISNTYSTSLSFKSYIHNDETSLLEHRLSSEISQQRLNITFVTKITRLCKYNNKNQ